MPVTTNSQAFAQNDAPQWARVIKARFGIHSLALDPPIWEMVFTEDIRDWTDMEICQTLKWMQGPEQSWKKPECAKDVVVAVKTYRKQLRAENDMPVEDCDYCRNGWLDWYRDADFTQCQNYEQVLDLIGVEYMCSTICQCPKGQKWLKSCHQYDKADQVTLEALDFMSRTAYKQAGVIRRMKVRA